MLNRVLGCVLLILVAFAAEPAFAKKPKPKPTPTQHIDPYWDTNGAAAGLGGTGNWSGSFWNTDSTGGAGGTVGTWTNSTSTDAVLAGTAGTLTIDSGEGSGVTIGTLTVNTDGYKITSTSNGRPLSAVSLVLANNVGVTFDLNSTGATWTLGGITFGTASTLTISGAATSGNANRINFNVANSTINGGSITLSGSGAGITGFVAIASGITLNTNITNNSSTSATMLGATNGNSLAYGGIISGSAGLQFSAGGSGGAGTVTLNAQSTYQGATTFNANSTAMIKLGVDNALPTTTDVTMAATSGNGGILDLNGHNQSIASLTSGAGGGSITNSAASTTSTLTINGSSSPAAFALAITDGGVGKLVALKLASTNTGTLTLSGTNTYTGGTTILGGTLSVTGDAQLGTAPGSATDNITINGGRLEITGVNQTLSANRNILLGATAGTSISTKSGSGTATYNGVFKDLTGNNGILVKQGADVLAVGGASTYSGNTAINNGTIQLTTGNNRLPTGTTVSLGQASSSNLGTLDLNGFNQQIAGLNSTTGTNATANKNTVTSSAAATLTLGGSGSYNYGDGSNANSGVITGTISLVKSGSGTQTLGDANTYSGTTTVSGGTLLVNNTSGSGTGTGAVMVNNGGTLGGTGTIAPSSGNNVQINGGGKITGATNGTVGALTLTSTNLVFSGASGNNATYVADISGATSDRLNVGGVLNLSGAFDQLNLVGTPDGTTTYTLATYTSETGTFDTLPTMPSSYNYQLIYGPTALTLAPIPEPGTYVAAALAAVVIGYQLIVIRRRKLRHR